MNLEVNLGGIRMKNPVTTASGTFGYQYGDFFDLSLLGAMVVKSITLKPKDGNPPPRICEVYAGMINSIGLENPGVDKFIEEHLPKYRQYDAPLIVSVAGNSVDDYCGVVEKLNQAQGIAGLEINISCPNVKDGLAFGTKAQETFDLISKLKNMTDYHLIVKLTPNVTNIVEIAESAYAGGASALAMINTLLGMKINLETQKPDIANKMGGYSGPPIKPVGVRCVYQVYAKLGNLVPILGMGGIMNSDDAVEYILAGATAVAVGTANFPNPTAGLSVIEGIRDYMEKKKVEDIKELIGKAHR